MKKEAGQPLFLPPFKGRIQSDYNHPLFLQAISDCHRLLDGPESEILLDSRNRVGVASLPLEDGQRVEIVIKEFYSRGANRLKSIFFASKAFKAWHGGNALVERGIKTPVPLAYLEKRKGLFLVQSFFLAKRIRGVEEVRFLLLELPPTELYELLVSLARYLTFCHKKGILHSDLSDGNILVEKDEAGKFRFYLIDTNRIKVKSQIGLLKRIKNLARLGVPPSFQHFFLEKYLETHKIKSYLWFWYRMNKVTYTHFIKLKKRLRLRKLAEKLKIQ